MKALPPSRYRNITSNWKKAVWLMIGKSTTILTLLLAFSFCQSKTSPDASYPTDSGDEIDHFSSKVAAEYAEKLQRDLPRQLQNCEG